MGIVGGVVGGVIGFAIGGPIGAAAGAAIGNAAQKVRTVCPHCGAKVLVEAGEYNCRCAGCKRTFIKRKGRAGTGTGPDSAPDGLTKKQKVQYLFFVSAFSLAAKVAQADGHIAREELRVVEDFMRRQLNLSGEDLKFARSVFDGALGSDEPIESFAGQCAGLFAGNQRHLRLILHFLFNISVADGRFHPSEEELIKTTARIFNIGDDEYSRIRAHYIYDIDRYYAILGCGKSDSDGTVKSIYKNLAKEYHPDKIVSKGLPDEFAGFARRKFDEIQQAYEKISEERGFK